MHQLDDRARASTEMVPAARASMMPCGSAGRVTSATCDTLSLVLEQRVAAAVAIAEALRLDHLAVQATVPIHRIRTGRPAA